MKYLYTFILIGLSFYSKGQAITNMPLNAPSIGYSAANNLFNYDGKSIAHYGLGWYTDTWQTGGPTAFISGWGGIKFFTIGRPVMSLNGNGQVGIGTENPGGKLHIDGPLDGSLATIRIGSSAPGNINVPVGSSTGGYNIDFQTWRDIRPELIGARIRAERINNLQHYNALVQSMDLAFYTSEGWEQEQLTEKLRIKSNGDVGIGTSDPKGYKLAVAGSVIAESVKVSLKSAWPDYVFASEYPLPALTEVKSYVNQNQHLPDIPSAKEVSEKGIDLGVMNAKLLKKVEELTLYLIEKDEEIKESKERLQIIEERLNQLISSLK